MEFLKAILGDDLYKQLEEKVNAHNGNEANKENQIKIGNLGNGEYVGKIKYDSEIEKLNALISGKDTELTTANNLIAELKKGTKGNEELQGKVTAYETQVTELQEKLKQTQIDSELKVAMLAAGVKSDDIDYLTFKLNSKGEKLEFGDDGKIKGIDDMISGLKTQYPAQFETSNNNGIKIDANPLQTGKDNEPGDPQNLADAIRMQYESNNN